MKKQSIIYTTEQFKNKVFFEATLVNRRMAVKTFVDGIQTEIDSYIRPEKIFEVALNPSFNELEVAKTINMMNKQYFAKENNHVTI